MVTHGLLFPHKQDVLSPFSYPLFWLFGGSSAKLRIGVLSSFFFFLPATGRAGNHWLNMNQTDYIGISIYIRIVARLFSLSFFIHYIHRDILSPNKFSFPLLHIENCKRPRRFLFIPAKYFHSRCSMKISNIDVGTIHRNVRISN